MSRKKYSGIFFLVLSASLKAAECPQWSNNEAKHRISVLAEEVWRHDVLYHEQNSPEISDAEYDALDRQLIRLQQCFPAISARRYQPETQKSALRHFAFMGSLKKADGEEDIKQFFQKFRTSGFILQPKIDGIAVELVYKRGTLVKAITRGNGESGENILRHVRHMPLIPKQLPDVIDLVLHGELFARLDLVDKRLFKKYVSARHLVAGQVNRKSPELASLAAIDFFPWRWVDAPFAHEMDSIKALVGFGFKHLLNYSHPVISLEEISRWRDVYSGKKNEIFLMDGIVIKSSNIKDRKSTERVRKNPDWALAWKFPAKTAVTTVIGIEFSEGKTGKVTPVLILSPVTIDGRVIQRVSLGSIKNYREKDIAVGDQVSVKLKGLATPVFGKVVIRNPERQKSGRLELD